ncbi:MAG TPA: hypothetical protein PJ988_06280, partial [Anaerolinea sp.]|nr:hypothetical protein [Anaerolinea sp.]
PGRVGGPGFEVGFDYATQKWFADLTVDTASLSYTPFIRLVLMRYQPFALPDSKLSAPVLADYIQLTPERSALLTADPYHPRRLRLTVSGPAPAGPDPGGGQPAAPHLWPGGRPGLGRRPRRDRHAQPAAAPARAAALVGRHHLRQPARAG